MINSTATQKLTDLLIHLDGAYAPNTLRAYKSDMLEFIEYCIQTNNSALPATPNTIGSFLTQAMGHEIKSSTIRRKVSSISAVHRLTSLEDPTKHPEVKIIQRKIFRQLGTRFDQAYPVTRVILDKMLSVCSKDLHGLRNRALLLVAYDSMRRRCELISLRIEDIEWLTEEGASILLRKSKTDQHGSGKCIHLSNETTSALENWLTAAQIKDGYLFRGIRAGGSITNSLCDSRVSRIYKSLANQAGLSKEAVEGISGHSMRVGGAQDLLSYGASLPQIMVKGGWAKTDTVMRYVERVSPARKLQNRSDLPKMLFLKN